MSRVSLVALGALLAAGPAVAQSSAAPDAFAFVTRLGADTVAVERLGRTPDGLTVDLVTRVPRTLRTQARLTLTPDEQMTGYEAVTTDPASGQEVRREVIAPRGDSLVVRVTTLEGTRARAFAAAPDALPFVEYAHFPFEVALTRGTAGPLPMVTERALLAFEIGRDGEQVTLRHPFRGVMTAETDPDGQLLALDASATTRKLSVGRAPHVDVEAAARRWAALDAAGEGLGPLSGRADVTATVAGATITLDHGQPSLRGREVWGAVVPWGQVWRTGADRATHLTTDRALLLGDATRGATLLVPAGRYTLYSIPEADGGTLIVSRQTDQNGATYDPDQDLGRVALAVRPLDAPVERFEIVAEPRAAAGADGRLGLRWGRTEFWVPFSVGD